MTTVQRSAIVTVLEGLNVLRTVYGIDIPDEILRDRAVNIVTALSGVGILASEDEFLRSVSEMRSNGIDVSDFIIGSEQT